MKLAIRTFLIVLLGFACTKPSTHHDARIQPDEDSLVYSLIHLVLTDTFMHRKKFLRILSETPSLPPPNNYDRTYTSFVSMILSERDTSCIHKQLRGSNHFSTAKMEKYGFTIVNLDSFRSKYVSKEIFWDRFYEIHGDGFLSVSKPILNCDKTKMFIRVAYICGNKCGGGSDLLLERSGASWTLKEKVGSWTS